jgi:hypothetical protein
MYIIIEYRWGVYCFVVFFNTKRRRAKKANIIICGKKDIRSPTIGASNRAGYPIVKSV